MVVSENMSALWQKNKEEIYNLLVIVWNKKVCFGELKN